MIDPSAVLVATLAGILLGAVVIGHIASLPTYASAATPGEVGRIVGAAGVGIGLVFYIGQAGLDRSEVVHLAGQLANWFAYSIGIGIGCYLRLLVDETQRKEAIQAMAQRQVDDETRDDG